MPADSFPEVARLRALSRSGLLDAPARNQFDTIAELVRDALNVPTAVVSIVDEDRQVFVGHCGLPEHWAQKGETPLTHSFCKHVVERAEPMAVADALTDPTLCRNEAIKDLGVVAYLGVPLALPTGEIVGALAAIAPSPRDWSAEDLQRLERIARVAANEIEIRVSEVKWRTLFAEMKEGFFIGEALRDREERMVDWRYLETNPAFEALTGLSATASLGRTYRELVPDGGDEIVETYARVVDEHTPCVFDVHLPSLRFPWFEGRARPLGSDRFAVIFTEITTRKDEEQRLAELDQRRRLSNEVGEIGIWDLDLAEGQLTIDHRARMIHGLFEERDLSFAQALAAIHPADRDRVVEEMDGLAKAGSEDMRIQFRVVGIDDGITRTILSSGRAMRDETGTAVRLVGVVRDVSERVAVEDRRQFLNQELAHRLKNTLAVVSAIVTQTLRSSTDIDSARRSLSARIQALSKAHDILLAGQRDAGTIGKIVEAAVAPHDEGRRVAIKGPALAIGPKASMTLALIIHELATNSGKYGALSVPEGDIAITWSVSRNEGSQAPVLDLQWVERNGPPVVAPARKGFGTRLIEMGLSGSSGGSSEIEYAADGLRCRILASLVELMSDEDVEPVN